MTEQPPGWDETWSGYGSEDLLAAKALIELSPALRISAEQYLGWSETDGHRGDDGVWRRSPRFDYEDWIADIEAPDGPGWSSTERRLFNVVASLLIPERTIRLVGVLDAMGSWEREFWQILVNWGTGGNNRDAPGRHGLG